MRKLGQWGLRDSVRYAVSKFAPAKPATKKHVRNAYLEPTLRYRDGIFRSLQEVANHYRFPMVTVAEQNSPQAQMQLKQWSADVAIFTGGNILRESLLKVPRLGVFNSHLALLPEIRGMSSPEWSLLCGVPLGITIHFMDNGIDSGAILSAARICCRGKLRFADRSAQSHDRRRNRIGSRSRRGSGKRHIAAIAQLIAKRTRNFLSCTSG